MPKVSGAVRRSLPRGDCEMLRMSRSSVSNSSISGCSRS
jgi:hypothetical protein